MKTGSLANRAVSESMLYRKVFAASGRASSHAKLRFGDGKLKSVPERGRGDSTDRKRTTAMHSRFLCGLAALSICTKLVVKSCRCNSSSTAHGVIGDGGEVEGGASAGEVESGAGGATAGSEK